MRTLFHLLIVLAVLSGCSNEETNTASDNKNWDEVTLDYAQHFRLFRKGEKFKLEIVDPDTKEQVESFVVSAASSDRVICLTATLTGMFCELNARSSLVGITAKNQLYDSKLKQRFAKGRIKEYGDFTQLSLECVVKANPKIILYNYVNNDFPHKEKLEKLGIQLVIVNDWLETHPLAKAEWIKVVGAITGKFDEASELFEEIEANYKRIQSEIEGIKDRPSVISGNLIGGSWYAPSGENYFGILINDAGGDYIYKDSRGAKSLALPLEKILEDNQNTEIWLNPGVSSMQQLLRINSHAKLLKASDSGTYCYSGEMNKFWEQSATRPDFVLDDLSHVFHPELDANYQFHFYAPLAK